MIIEKIVEKIIVKEVPRRRKLPDERLSLTHKFSVAGHEGYIHVGMYEDGTPGEMFVKMSKEGSTLSGVMDTLALSLSMNLQYGVPLEVLCEACGREVRSGGHDHEQGNSDGESDGLHGPLDGAEVPVQRQSQTLPQCRSRGPRL